MLNSISKDDGFLIEYKSFTQKQYGNLDNESEWVSLFELD